LPRSSERKPKKPDSRLPRWTWAVIVAAGVVAYVAVGELLQGNRFQADLENLWRSPSDFFNNGAETVAKTDFKSVDEYIATHARDVQPTLQRVRSAIRKALPKAEEVISYQIAGYRLHGGVVLYFAGFKEHYSIYPANARLIAAFKDELAPYEYNNEGTIRFPLSRPVPVGLIGRIAKFRAKEAEALAKAKQAKAKQGKAKRGEAKPPRPKKT
jgi:uncharacterized protein YdhG (YjbR/CyaY superfamily)